MAMNGTWSTPHLWQRNMLADVLFAKLVNLFQQGSADEVARLVVIDRGIHLDLKFHNSHCPRSCGGEERKGKMWVESQRKNGRVEDEPERLGSERGTSSAQTADELRRGEGNKRSGWKRRFK